MWLGDLTAEQRTTLMRLAYNVMVSDGLLDPGEEGMLAELRREMSVPADVEIDYQELSGIEGIFAERRARLIAVLNLLRVSYADGAFEIDDQHQVVDPVVRHEEVDDRLSFSLTPLGIGVGGERLDVAVAFEQVAVDHVARGRCGVLQSMTGRGLEIL